MPMMTPIIGAMRVNAAIEAERSVEVLLPPPRRLWRSRRGEAASALSMDDGLEKPTEDGARERGAAEGGCCGDGRRASAPGRRRRRARERIAVGLAVLRILATPLPVLQNRSNPSGPRPLAVPLRSPSPTAEQIWALILPFPSPPSTSINNATPFDDGRHPTDHECDCH